MPEWARWVLIFTALLVLIGEGGIYLGGRTAAWDWQRTTGCKPPATDCR